MRRATIVLLFSVFLVFLATALVQASIQSCKAEFKTTEPVKIKSTARLCNNIDENAEIKLYIVEDRNEIPLTVTKQVNILNSQFPCTEMWPDSVAGEYDVFIDCIQNDNYDILEPFTSFKVTALSGTASVSLGDIKIEDHIWRHDPEEPELINEMLQIKLRAEGEDVELENITIRASGTGDDSEILILEIYLDKNNNGKLDGNDELIGDSQPAYLVNDATTTIFPDLVVEKGVSSNLLIVYTMQETISEGEFSLSIMSITGTGLNSQGTIKFSGAPVISGKKTVLPEKTCLGELTLELEPSSAKPGGQVNAKMSGVSGCGNKTISLKPNPCGSLLAEKICSCNFTEGAGGCECSFTASKSATYHACIDKNDDGDRIDFGEYDFQDLVLEGVEEEIGEENVTEIIENMTEEGELLIPEEETGITGGVIEELRAKITGTNSLFILLEITLLLILFVLIMIMFRLKELRVAMKGETEEDEEE